MTVQACLSEIHLGTTVFVFVFLDAEPCFREKALYLVEKASGFLFRHATAVIAGLDAKVCVDIYRCVHSQF